ncbi:MAG: DUF4860 domain-containing protein [Lachnospiraceae bacterium]|nr:DUF4860 domain-containing protein [Lachnospiraceae bacterium]MCR5768937.1 DUF4860 domain-containing protein [Lachnospiraceae bacterium]
MADLDDKRVESRSKLVNAAGTVVLIALFAISALVLLSAGMQVYKNVVLASNENFELRTSLSYVATRIRQFDASGSVDVVNLDGMNTLVLSENFEGDIYNTLIYYKNGYLCELTQADGYEPDFDFGFETIEIDDFSIEKQGNFIVLSAANASGDKETLKLTLRSQND